MFVHAAGNEACRVLSLFQAPGYYSSFKNTWTGWYSAGSTVNSGSGKRAAYDTLPLSSLRLSDASGRFVEYKLNKGYAGRTLLSIVQGCMGSSRKCSDSSAWTAGLCSNVGTRISSSGSFGTFSLSEVLRIGVGDADGQNDGDDWALLMPLNGNGKGDFARANAWAFAGEDEMNNGHSGTVTISTCPGALFHSLKVDAILVLGGYYYFVFCLTLFTPTLKAKIGGYVCIYLHMSLYQYKTHTHTHTHTRSFWRATQRALVQTERLGQVL